MIPDTDTERSAPEARRRVFSVEQSHCSLGATIVAPSFTANSRDTFAKRMIAGEINRVLDELDRNGLLSDQRFAGAVARSRSQRFGDARIRYDLRKFGIADDLSAAVLTHAVRKRSCACRCSQIEAIRCAARIRRRARQAGSVSTVARLFARLHLSSLAGPSRRRVIAAAASLDCVGRSDSPVLDSSTGRTHFLPVRPVVVPDPHAQPPPRAHPLN